MSQQDHDLMESVAADNDPAITIPASPPRRDSVEDADSSLTRKRPRLDSSGPNIRAMSTEPISPSAAAASPEKHHYHRKQQQVEMTIRSQPPSSSQPDDGMDSANGPSEVPPPAHEHSPVVVGSTEEDVSVSPPVVIVDDDEDRDQAQQSAEDPVDYMEPTPEYAQIELDADTYFQQFPFAQNGNYMQAVRNLANHIHGASPIDGTVLPLIERWLMALPDPPAQIDSFYVERAIFWEEFANLINKVLVRRYRWMSSLLNGDQDIDSSRYPFGDQFCDDGQSEDDIFYTFLSAYMKICANLLQVDADSIRNLKSQEGYTHTLLSHKHIRHIYTIFRQEKSPVFHLLTKEYALDGDRIAMRLVLDFLKFGGIQSLLQLADVACHEVPSSTQNWIAAWTPQILSSIGWFLFQYRRSEDVVDRSLFHRDVLHFFRTYSEDLQIPSKAADAGVTRDLIIHFSNLLTDLCQWDGDLAAELVEEFLDFQDAESPTSTAPSEVSDNTPFNDTYRQDSLCFPALVMNAWRFKLLRRYIVKGRMELRVMSIGAMDNALIEIYREFNTIDPTGQHPVMQYLADFLLHGRVIDYIISVDSHPQLIQRSGNVVGFLVVTHRYSNKQTDAIWKAISSPDPRVVAATMTMFRGIFQLMDTKDQLYLCSKLFDLPIEAYTVDILRFLRELTTKIQEKYYDWSSADLKSRPWNVCIRLLQDTPLGKDTTKLTAALHAEASEQLRLIAAFVGLPERHQIYQDCAAHIQSRSTKATGSLRAISILAYTPTYGDATFFMDNQDVTRQILKEIISFVATESRTASYPHQMQALQYRLEVLSLLITRATEVVMAELYQDIWDHLVGKYALTNQARDLAWTQFSEAVRIKPDNDFCKRLISIYVPELDPQFYTLGLYDFVAKYGFRTSRRLVPTDDGEKELLQIRGADLLWSIVLSAPEGSIESSAARLLATRYIEVQEELDVCLEEVEEAHVALVEQCMKELKSAYRILRGEAFSQGGTSDDMDIAVPDEVRHDNEVRIGRVLLLEKLLLALIRQRPEFNRSRRADSKVEPLEADLPYGDAVEIRYQSGNDKTSVQMGAEHTVQDLYRRLCHATGYTKINLFANGQRLNVAEKADQKLLDMNLGGLLLVQKAPGSETTRPVLESNTGCSVFEVNLLEHFEELFACMDSDDHISQLLFDFLTLFPPRDRFASSVISGEATSDQLFPPGKFYQTKYAVQALQYKLREQVRSSSLNETFLARAVQLLDHALLSPALISDLISDQHELHLAATLVSVLLEFLKERPSPETSSSYFSNSSQLANRLVKILATAIDSESDHSQVVCTSYALILEASLHCRGVWEAFMSNPETPAIHQMLLLTDSRRSLREHVAQSITSVCGGDLPSTCPLKKAEIAARFWALISMVLPEAVRHPDQSIQLFELAEHVFRCNDESSRDEDSLRSSFATWSELLLEHRHKEIVGRDETDFIVLGFTKLLLCCVPSLKSFKKPLNAGPLMKHIFTKFLFIPKVAEVEEDATQVPLLPVLDSQTRRELYDLLLALAEDRTSFDTLLDLAGEVEDDEWETSLQSFAVDRTNEIRSRTGYVGLNNPRAICYMNSLLTQLFMNVNFRKFMLGLDIADASSQRLLAETQKLFAQMQNSYRKSTDPREFAFCVKNPDQRPIDINIQMDADEFYNLLFDQWEGQMLSADVKKSFRSFYGGHTVNQIKSKECEHVSERSEPFFVVQCDVQGKANLQESLQAFVEGDVMEGDNKYKCESCGGRFVDAVKRTCLKDVPDNLIFHLKRFDFDLSELRRAKVNDYFEFPNLIDVSPYNIEHLSDPSRPRKEDVYELVGVLVHQGTSENGHYYSYIRERPCPPGGANNWVEFNDREVDKFDHASIPYHTFGGPYDDQFRQQKQFSAYMLFYQRQVAIDEDRREYMACTQSESPKVPVPEPLANEVDADNEFFIREYSLFDPNHSKFVRQMLTTLRSVNHGTCSEDHEQESRTLHIVLGHLSHIVCRLRTPEPFEEILLQVRKAVLSCPACCNIAVKWLASEESALVNLLLRCIHTKIRSQARAFLIDCLRFLREKDPVLYGAENMDTDMEVGTPTPNESVLFEVTQRLRLVADKSYLSSRGWDDLYLTLCQIADMGHLETAVILNHGILEFCLGVLGMHAHATLRTEMPEIWRIMEKKRNIFNRMIELVYRLLTTIDIQLPLAPETRGGHRLETPEQEDFQLSRQEKEFLVLWHDENRAIAVLDKMIEQFDRTKTDNFFPGDVLKWMLLSPDTRLQQMLYLTVYEGVHQLSPPHSDPFIRAALSFCEASPSIDHVERVLEAVTKAAGEIRDTGGEPVIQFFSGLLTVKNEHVFQARHSHYFYEYCLLASRKYALPLLLYEDDMVRKITQTFLQELFSDSRAIEVVIPETLIRKYQIIRYLAQHMMLKIVQEHENGTSRMYMSPMISACGTFVQLLYLLTESDDPVLDECKHINDNALIHQWQLEIDTRLRHWPQDESTPVSTGEPYEHSDYGSESDDGPDLLEM